MPNTQAAKKALRQSAKRRARNDARKKKIKELRKDVLKAMTDGTVPDELVVMVYKALDKAAKTNAIHPNKAARLKSRLRQRLNATKKA